MERGWEWEGRKTEKSSPLENLRVTWSGCGGFTAPLVSLLRTPLPLEFFNSRDFHSELFVPVVCPAPRPCHSPSSTFPPYYSTIRPLRSSRLRIRPSSLSRHPPILSVTTSHCRILPSRGQWYANPNPSAVSVPQSSSCLDKAQWSAVRSTGRLSRCPIDSNPRFALSNRWSQHHSGCPALIWGTSICLRGFHDVPEAVRRRLHGWRFWSPASL